MNNSPNGGTSLQISKQPFDGLADVIALLLAALLVISLAACGTSSGKTTANDNSTPQAADTMVITADSYI